MILRIRGRESFARVARDGTRARGAALWCTHLPDSSTSATHVAYSVGRAVGPAVTRNRVRRRLRAALRDLDRTGRLPSGALLIGATPAAAERTYDALATEMAQLLARVTTP